MKKFKKQNMLHSEYPLFLLVIAPISINVDFMSTEQILSIGADLIKNSFLIDSVDIDLYKLFRLDNNIDVPKFKTNFSKNDYYSLLNNLNYSYSNKIIESFKPSIIHSLSYQDQYKIIIKWICNDFIGISNYLLDFINNSFNTIDFNNFNMNYLSSIIPDNSDLTVYLNRRPNEIENFLPDDEEEFVPIFVILPFWNDTWPIRLVQVFFDASGQHRIEENIQDLGLENGNNNYNLTFNIWFSPHDTNETVPFDMIGRMPSVSLFPNEIVFTIQHWIFILNSMIAAYESNLDTPNYVEDIRVLQLAINYLINICSSIIPNYQPPAVPDLE